MLFIEGGAVLNLSIINLSTIGLLFHDTIGQKPLLKIIEIL
jgi:hypothetical protein